MDVNCNLYNGWFDFSVEYDVSLPLGEITEKYIREILIPDRTLRFGTKEGYIIAYRKHFRGLPITKRPLEQVRAIDLQYQYNVMDCGARAIQSINILLSKLYSFLQMQSDIINITQNVHIPKAAPKGDDVEVWSDDELMIISSSLVQVPRIRFLIVLLMNTGCRISELLGLKYSDITGHNLTINKQLQKFSDLNGSGTKCWYDTAPPKSASSFRTIPLSDYVVNEFEIHKEWHREQMRRHGFKTDFIFTTKSGHVIDKRSETLTFRRYYDRIGVPYRSFHVYRHTFATNLCRKGVPIQITSKLLGHASVNVTAKYYINVDEQQKINAINLIAPKV